MNILTTQVKPGNHKSVDLTSSGGTNDEAIAAVTGKSIVICDIFNSSASSGTFWTESGGTNVIAHVGSGQTSYSSPIRVKEGMGVFTDLNALITITYYLV